VLRVRRKIEAGGSAADDEPAVPGARQCRWEGPAVPVGHELDEQLDELGGNWIRKSSILAEIDGIGRGNLERM
jgi:hypothetical protein